MTTETHFLIVDDFSIEHGERLIGRDQRLVCIERGQIIGASGLEELFGANARNIVAASRDFTFRYRSPEHFVDVFRTFYGPMNKAFAALEGEPHAAFLRDLMTLIESRNRSNDATLVLPSEYLEVVVERV